MSLNSWIIRIIGFIFLILFQVLVLDNLGINLYIHPYVYPLFIILLPFETPSWLLLLLAFLTGLIIDMFTNTPGMHAAACVFIAYMRPYLVKIMTPLTGYEGIRSPSISQLGIVWFSLFTLALIFVHHFIYFFIQGFSFDNFGFTFLKVAISTAVSTLLIIILAYLFAPGKVRR